VVQGPVGPGSGGYGTSARRDFAEGLGWLAFGFAVLIGSLAMARLQDQGVPPYAAPGLLPGLLGIVLILFGGLLALRGWRSRGRSAASARGDRAGSWRLALVLALCLVFGLGLVGHGLPFWAASALFVASAILVLQKEDKASAARRVPRRVAYAVVIGLGAGVGVTLLFQGLFLVRLP
jgi:Tripartite tricarboxylate transporter TctB family